MQLIDCTYKTKTHNLAQLVRDTLDVNRRIYRMSRGGIDTAQQLADHGHARVSLDFLKTSVMPLQLSPLPLFPRLLNFVKTIQIGEVGMLRMLNWNHKIILAKKKIWKCMLNI